MASEQEMAIPAKASPGAVATGIVLSALSLLLWALLLPSLANLAGSDAAGNALAQAYAAIAAVVLWVLLAVFVLIGWIKGKMPAIAAIAALVLVPGSGYAALTAMDLLSRPGIPPHLWPIIIPAAIPPLIISFCFWALTPPLRAVIPAGLAAGLVWGAVLILSVSIVPMDQIRNRADQQTTARMAKSDEDYARLPPDAALWDLTPFLETRNETKANAVLDRIRALDQRQSQAEIMLDRGDFPLGYLGRFDLDPTPAICEKARSLLRRQVEPLVLKTPDSEPYARIFRDVADAVAAMTWLVGYECSCDAEALAWESMAQAYRDTGFDVVKLARLRDPKELGRVLREYPARFSMLTPKAHLKAWLRYANDPSLREQALAGARKLDHRTADAIEMLTDKLDPGAPWTLLKYLPVLDLEVPGPLCGIALTRVRDEIAKAYRPRADDPRRYDELLSRLGAGEPLTALIWLAGHGCNAEAELSQAEDLVRSYQDSPDRAAMLAGLAQLRRKP
jgi:hypothetical protein